MKNENPAMLVPPERFAENVKTIRARVAPKLIRALIFIGGVG